MSDSAGKARIVTEDDLQDLFRDCVSPGRLRVAAAMDWWDALPEAKYDYGIREDRSGRVDHGYDNSSHAYLDAGDTPGQTIVRRHAGPWVPVEDTEEAAP